MGALVPNHPSDTDKGKVVRWSLPLYTVSLDICCLTHTHYKILNIVIHWQHRDLKWMWKAKLLHKWTTLFLIFATNFDKAHSRHSVCYQILLSVSLTYNNTKLYYLVTFDIPLHYCCCCCCGGVQGWFPSSPYAQRHVMILVLPLSKVRFPLQLNRHHSKTR